MENYKFANRITGVSPSATLEMGRKAKELANQGVEVINLSLGEPDFVTPKFIDEAAKKAIDSGLASFYTATLGINELRMALANYYDSIAPLDFKNFGVTASTKLALYALLQILISDGEKVVVAAPYWVSYEQQVKLAMGDLYAVFPDNPEMKLTTKELDELDFIPKAIILNNPTNPTGAVYSKEELLDIINWAEVNQVYLIVDEIYGKLVYNGTKFTSVLELKEINNSKLIVVDGVSKSYSMTGWRLGWVIADPKIISKLGEVLDHVTSNPAAVSQYAALAAITSDGSSVEEMRCAFEERLNTTYDKLQEVNGLTIVDKPQGAFYLFLKVDPALLKRKGLKDTKDLAMEILNQAHVALAAGEGFGTPGYLRMSYAKSQTELDEAIKRIKGFLNE
ncbi:pyridoxal phosphate-dependent aminotransferase [Xylocopilactobacillus apis]|uniref:Aminotransferase n=1 Tax=Xylocopilactobacillus apis TaxID=2932183 RepID=A0AAU9DC22_9LACO|nr:pyridoxal phosphate-dependent aminotransferase [Xylocopilactobacillus apis]BDR57315.1 aminotransferase [Xylocopilactobacillus apis]